MAMSSLTEPPGIMMPDLGAAELIFDETRT